MPLLVVFFAEQHSLYFRLTRLTQLHLLLWEIDSKLNAVETLVNTTSSMSKAVEVGRSLRKLRQVTIESTEDTFTHYWLQALSPTSSGGETVSCETREEGRKERLSTSYLDSATLKEASSLISIEVTKVLLYFNSLLSCLVWI